MMPMTPRGSRVISTSTPGRIDWIFSPASRSASPPKNLKICPARTTSPMPSGKVLPSSRERSRPSSSLRARIAFPTASSRFARSWIEDIDHTGNAARAAFPVWSMSSIQDRANLLDAVGNAILARKDELGRLLSREEGKTLPEGIGEVVRAGQIFKFFGGEALRLAGEKIPSVRPGIDVEITREPIGVVGIITPW